MARPQKAGIDYFPMDVDMDQDDKILLIEAEHGVEGFGILVKLLMKIYKEGYYYEWTDKEQLLFSKRVNVDINRVNVVINSCLKWGFLDKTMFDKYCILTSSGIQKRYLEATSRRKKVEIIKEYCLIDPSKYSNIVIVDINGVNVDINPSSEGNNVDNNSSSGDINDNNYPQSKVKKSKVKNSTENNTRKTKNKSQSGKVQFAEYVSMTNAEYEKLVSTYGEANTARMIEKLDNYKGATGKKYKSDYRAILNWVTEEVLKDTAHNQTFRDKSYQPLMEAF